MQNEYESLHLTLNGPNKVNKWIESVEYIHFGTNCAQRHLDFVSLQPERKKAHSLHNNNNTRSFLPR